MPPALRIYIFLFHLEKLYLKRHRLSATPSNCGTRIGPNKIKGLPTAKGDDSKKKPHIKVSEALTSSALVISSIGASRARESFQRAEWLGGLCFVLPHQLALILTALIILITGRSATPLNIHKRRTIGRTRDYTLHPLEDAGGSSRASPFDPSSQSKWSS